MSPRVLSFHHFMKAAIVLGFAMFIVYLGKTDDILYYIAPRMVSYVKWTAVGLYAIGIYEIYLALKTLWGQVQECDCEHPPSRSVVKNTAIYGLFIFPLLLGFLLPNATLGSSMAAKKGMNLSSASNLKKDLQPAAAQSSTGSAAAAGGSVSDDRLNEMFKADKFTQAYAAFGKQLYKSDVLQVKDDLFIETLNTVDLYLDNFVGKRMELNGFVYRQDGMNDKQFVVARFAIQCCSADAAPFGVLAEYDRAQSLANDTWIRASGVLQKTTYNGEEIMLLKLDHFEKIDAPKDQQYVYPNPDFGL
jgi:putative membrane protein